MSSGISLISNRYARGNNKHTKNYNAGESSKYIMYLDDSNRYGWAMSQYLPTGGFKCVSEKEIESTQKKARRV